MESQISKLINQLAFDFLKVLSSKENGNIFYSPFNLFLSLNSLAFGAKEATQTQICHALKMSDYFENITEMLEETSQVLQIILRETHLNSLFLANKVLIRKSDDSNINDDFANAIELMYTTSVEQIDFTKEHIVDGINSWVFDTTFEKIVSLVEKIDPSSNTVLLNAAYFHGQWKSKFDENETELKPFCNESGIKDIPFMFLKNVTCKLYILVFEDEDVEILELPFIGSITMNILLPRNLDAMEYLYDAIDYLTLEEYKDNEATKVNVWLPRFEIEAKYEFNDALKQIGVIDAFGMDANFSSIRDANDVRITRMVHKCCIKVDEQGIDAVQKYDTFCIFNCLPTNVRTICVDRPFIFYVQDLWTRVILFIGKIKDL